MPKSSVNEAKNHRTDSTKKAATIGLGIAVSTIVLTAGALSGSVVAANAMPIPVDSPVATAVATQDNTPRFEAAVYIPQPSTYVPMRSVVTQTPNTPMERLLAKGTTTAPQNTGTGIDTGKPPVKKVRNVIEKKMRIPIVVAHSKAANDMHGRMPSLYTGKYYFPAAEQFRLCVAEREGMFTYSVRGGGGNNYYGTYQFSSAFQHGIPYMMAKESRQTGDGLAPWLLSLRNKPINTWNRYAQDRAFFTVLSYNGKWSGKHHWDNGRWYC